MKSIGLIGTIMAVARTHMLQMMTQITVGTIISDMADGVTQSHTAAAQRDSAVYVAGVQPKTSTSCGTRELYDAVTIACCL